MEPRPAGDPGRLRRAARLLKGGIKILLVLGLAGAATLLTLMRIYLPRVVEDRALVESWLSAQLERPVRLAAVSAGVIGLSPGIEFSGVTLMSRDGSAVLATVARIEARLSWWHSVRTGRPSLSRLVIRSPKITLRLIEGGVLSFGDTPLISPGAQGQRGVLEWIAQQPRAFVSDIDGRILAETGDQVVGLTGGNAWLHRRGGAAQVVIRGRLDGEVTGSFGAAARLRTQTEGPVADVFVEAEGLNFALARRVGYGLDGTADLRLWLRIRTGRLTALAGDGTLTAGALSIPGLAGRRELSMRVGAFTLARADQDWVGRLTDVSVARERDSPRHIEQLTVRYEASAGRVSGEGRVIDLGLLGELAADFDRLEPAIRRRIRDTAPQGVVSRLAFSGRTLASGDLQVEALEAKVESLALVSIERLPGIEGLDLSISLRGDHGGARIESTGARLWWGEVLRGPIDIDRIDAQLAWQRTATDWQLKVQGLHVAGAQTAVTAAATLGAAAGEPARLGVVGQVDYFDLSTLRRYLPAGVLHPRAVRWLDDAIVGGRVAPARVVAAGRIDEFPFSGESGRLLARAQMVDVDLDYAPGRDWPALQNLALTAYLDGSRLELVGTGGRILDSDITGVRAVIGNLAERPMQLAVTGQVAADAMNALRIFSESPLRRNVGSPFIAWRAEGQVGIDLGLDIVLARKPRVVTEGVIDLSLQELDMRPTTGLVAQDVAGRLAFGNQGVSAQSLRARLLGGPAQLEINSDRASGSLRTTLTGSGSLNSAELGRYAGIGAEVMTGRADWRASVVVDSGRIDVALASDLKGTAIDAPDPLRKALGSTKPLDAKLRCDCGDAPVLRVQLQLGSDQGAALELARRDGDWSVTRGAIASAVDPVLPEAGTWLVGAVPEIDFAEWLYWYRGLDGDGPVMTIDHIDAVFERIHLFGQPFEAVKVAAVKNSSVGNSWRFELQGNDVRGTVEADGGENPRLHASLDYLAWRGGAADGVPDSNPRAFPPLEIAVGELFYEDRALGRLEVTANPIDRGLRFDKIDLRRGGSHLSGTLDWLEAEPHGQLTRAEFKATTVDLGEFVRLLGVKDLVAGGKGDLTFEGQWPGGPADFRLAAIAGEVTANLQKGSLLGIEPGVGRLFGILSLQSVERRLSLDFGDVVGSGLVYDRLETQLAVAGGQGELKQFELQSPAADISLHGAIDFDDRTVDLNATSIPKVTSSLPVAGAIGSLGLGAAILLGQRLLEPQIEQWTRRYYRITGRWAEPVVRRIGRSEAPVTGQR